MPFVEVVHAAETPASTDQKRAFAEDIRQIFNEVLGTPPPALRIVFYRLDAEDSSGGLLDRD